MDKFVPIGKQSKKKQKEFNAKQRKTWGDFSPITRTVPNGKAYNRKKLKSSDRRNSSDFRNTEKAAVLLFISNRTFDMLRTSFYDGTEGGACYVQTQRRPSTSHAHA